MTNLRFKYSKTLITFGINSIFLIIDKENLEFNNISWYKLKFLKQFLNNKYLLRKIIYLTIEKFTKYKLIVFSIYVSEYKHYKILIKMHIPLLSNNYHLNI